MAFVRYSQPLHSRYRTCWSSPYCTLERVFSRPQRHFGHVSPAFCTDAAPSKDGIKRLIDLSQLVTNALRVGKQAVELFFEVVLL